MTKPYKSLCYCTNLRRSANAVTDYYDKALKESGLKASQYYLLINLSRMESANITQWAQHVGLERSTMVRNVRVLQKHGWVKPLPQGQGKQFALSEDGHAVLSAAIPCWEEAQKKMEEFLGKEEISAILTISEKLQELNHL